MQQLDVSISNLGWNPTDYPNLVASFTRSADAIEKARNHLEDKLSVDDATFDVVAFGSLARYEMTTESDFDYLVVAYSLDAKPGTARKGLELADGLRLIIGDGSEEVRKPGSTGVFGQMVSAPDMVEVIGLESDTNHSHTRRILLLEESVSLFNADHHRRLINVMIHRYLDAKPAGNALIPRFLLNDLARYWRTLTIDYQAKTPNASAYSLRYLKLIISRKFTYVSSILPLLLLGSHEMDEGDIAARLIDIYTKPPLIRFLDSVAILKDSDPDLEAPLKDCLMTVEEFNGRLGSKQWREMIDTDSKTGNAKEQPTFSEARDLGRRLQSNLEEVFFHERLLPLTRKYLVF